MIVGGGAAGMEAARVSCLRGHEVTLYERTPALGGNLIPASVPSFKKDIAALLDWYKGELGRLNLRVQRETEVTPERIAKEKPEIVILATGSKPIIPQVPGINRDGVTTATDFLLGKKQARQNVLVLGGGLIGCETALWLAQQGKKVTVVEILADILTAGIPVQPMNRLMLVDLLRYHRVDVIRNTSLLEVLKEEVLLIDKGFQRKRVPAETVVLAVGMRPDPELFNQLHGEIPNLYLIGDGRQAQNIMNSVWDAYEVARMI
jgi:2-enoate reductase